MTSPTDDRTALEQEAPMFAALLIKLKEECEAQHARAEKAEAEITALRAQLEKIEKVAKSCRLEDVIRNPNPESEVQQILTSFKAVAALRAQVAQLTQERDAARALSPVNAAAICTFLKEECEREHARAEHAEARLTALEKERDEATANALDLAARISFLCSRDIPETTERARAQLLSRLAELEAREQGLREALRERSQQ